jgi:predicted dinucleotide-binding enzyme
MVCAHEHACRGEYASSITALEQHMNIGIIGAGHIGGTLTKRLATLGHQVSVANSRGPETLADLARESGATAVTIEQAARDKDLVIVTIPEKAIPTLPRNLFATVRPETVVVDTGNYYPQRDGRIEPVEKGMTESRWVSTQLGRPVIKAFNNIHAKDLMERGQAAGSPGRIALPVAGDDPRAKRVVMDLIEQLGFTAVDAGSLDESWRQQPGSPVYGANHDAPGVRDDLTSASKERAPNWQA